MTSTHIEIHEAQFPLEIELVRLLFREYATGLGVDLCFQGFESELASLPGRYTRPQGGVWLASAANQPAACVALRPHDRHTAEMKRLYVRPDFRGMGLGRRLVNLVVTYAADAGYRRICLDTLPAMSEAIGLYRQMGFKPIEAYYQNPIAGALFFAKDLSHG